MGSDGADATYGYAELAERIDQVLGRRPSLSSLRAAHVRPSRSGVTGKPPRLTAGLPAPLSDRSRRAPARFSVVEVERWLASHPLLGLREATAQTQLRLSRGEDVDEVVAVARRAGLSWREITRLLAAVDDQPRTVAGVHKRYRDQANQS